MISAINNMANECRAYKSCPTSNEDSFCHNFLYAAAMDSEKLVTLEGPLTVSSTSFMENNTLDRILLSNVSLCNMGITAHSLGSHCK